MRLVVSCYMWGHHVNHMHDVLRAGDTLFSICRNALLNLLPPGTLVFTMWLSVMGMRSKAWLAARKPLRLPRLPHTASSAQCSHRLRFTRAAAPVLLVHAEITTTELQ
jgi:hypothetical protein